MIIVNDIRGSIYESRDNIIGKAAKIAGIKNPDTAFIWRRGLDARRQTPSFVYSVAFDVSGKADAQRGITVPAIYSLPQKFGTEKLSARPVIMGYGPAGIFCAYLLSLCGYAPVVFEKGSEIDTRNKKVKSFFDGGSLDVNTNVQFGEGGAGTYSDGKLTTRINNPACRFILEEMVKFGAPEDILWLAKPHIGTDKLGNVVKNIRSESIRLGAQFHFDSEITDINIKNGKVVSVTANGVDYPCGLLVSACGHSARDVYSMLKGKDIAMQGKSFSVGVRIEHLQSDVNRSLFGDFASEPILGSADYNVSYRSGSRGTYSFCMCPGGQVVAASSEEGGLVVNGMSAYKRDDTNANSALCVSVLAEDFGGDPFKGIAFQRELERRAFTAAGSDYSAPVQLVGDFKNGRVSKSFGKVKPSYPRRTSFCDLNSILPSFVSEGLKTGLNKFKGSYSFFGDADALLTGVETRTSAPVRITRGENLTAIGVDGFYPCGEGAGYAGGIMSAAADGIRVAEEIISRYSPEV